MSRYAGVVLAGGRSSRMGSPKAALEWHGSTLLRHVTGVVGRAVDGPVVVVRAPDQPLPALGSGVLVADDPVEGRGPLQGIAVGLSAAAEHTEHAFVCSTDLPFLHPVFVQAVLRGFEPATVDNPTGRRPDVVLPVVHGYRQPLAAGYRTDLAGRTADLLEQGKSRPAHLFEECTVRRLDEQALLANHRLAEADPQLDSVLNVNGPDDYEDARSRPAPEVVVQRYGVLATRGGGERGPRRVRAASVASAAQQLGLALDGHVLAAVNGDQIGDDGHLPLLAGDTVAFLSADAGG